MKLRISDALALPVEFATQNGGAVIRIGHEGPDVTVDIQHGLGGTDAKEIRLTWRCGSDITAAALARVLRNALGDRVQAIGQEAYIRGWKDAKAKRAKLSTWWRRSL